VEGIGPVETFLKGYVAGVLLVDFGLLGGGHVGVVVDWGLFDGSVARAVGSVVERKRRVCGGGGK
jgi:hypothetical protein